MLTVTIKIENNNLGKAKTELEALLVTVNELAKTYPTEGIEEVIPLAEKPVTKKRAPRTKKVAEEPEVKAEVEKEVEPEPTPVKEEKAVEKPSEDTLTLADMTALAKKAVAGSDRDTVKDLIASYGKGKLSSVEEAKFEPLAAELRGLAA